MGGICLGETPMTPILFGSQKSFYSRHVWSKVFHILKDLVLNFQMYTPLPMRRRRKSYAFGKAWVIISEREICTRQRSRSWISFKGMSLHNMKTCFPSKAWVNTRLLPSLPLPRMNLEQCSTATCFGCWHESLALTYPSIPRKEKRPFKTSPMNCWQRITPANTTMLSWILGQHIASPSLPYAKLVFFDWNAKPLTADE